MMFYLKVVPSVFTWIFLAALVLTVSTRLWLAQRQIRHIAANRAAVPAEFTNQIDLAAHQKAADYTIAKTRFGMLALWVDTAIALGFTVLGGLDWLDKTVRMLTGSSYGPVVTGLLLVAAVGLISSIVEVPFAYYKQFKLESRFGFNNMTARLFWTDWVRGLVLGAALGGPLLAAILYLMNAAGPYWWVYAWLVWSGFSVALMVLYPTVIAPLFNKFTPLESGDTRTRIEQLLNRCGFSSSGLFVMDGSKRSSHGNAYFTGMGKAKRIVFFDTLLSRLSNDQIEAVLAHELGHFKKKHVFKHLIFSFVFSLIMLFVLDRLMSSVWFYTGLGVTPNLLGSNDAMALVLFSLTLGYFTFPLKPVMSVMSRKHEFEADAYAAEHTQAKDLIDALVKLYKDNASTLTPDPIHSAFYDSHPPASIRIARLKTLATA